MRIVVAILVAVICSYVGIIFGRRYRDRYHMLQDVMLFLEEVKRRILFEQTKLGEIADHAAKKFSSPFSQILVEYRQLLASGTPITVDTLAPICKHPALKKDDQQLMGQMFAILGKSDATMQQQSIEQYQTMFRSLCDNAQKESGTYCSMYTKLGVLTGIGLGVLVI